MVERSEDLGLFDLRAVEELLARARPPRWRRFVERCIEAGLPRPHTNYVEHGFEIDCS